MWSICINDGTNLIFEKKLKTHSKFFISLRLYPIDKKRTNEFGESFEDSQNEDETKKLKDE